MRKSVSMQDSSNHTLYLGYYTGHNPMHMVDTEYCLVGHRKEVVYWSYYMAHYNKPDKHLGLCYTLSRQ